MDKGKFKLMLCVDVQDLCDRIRNYYNVSYNEALRMLYNSKLYYALEDEEIKMWYFSSYDLFEMFKLEQETGSYISYGGLYG